MYSKWNYKIQQISCQTWFSFHMQCSSYVQYETSSGCHSVWEGKRWQKNVSWLLLQSDRCLLKPTVDYCTGKTIYKSPKSYELITWVGVLLNNHKSDPLWFTAILPSLNSNISHHWEISCHRENQVCFNLITTHLKSPIIKTLYFFVSPTGMP